MNKRTLDLYEQPLAALPVELNTAAVEAVFNTNTADPEAVMASMRELWSAHGGILGHHNRDQRGIAPIRGSGESYVIGNSYNGMPSEELIQRKQAGMLHAIATDSGITKALRAFIPNRGGVRGVETYTITRTANPLALLGRKTLSVAQSQLAASRTYGLDDEVDMYRLPRKKEHYSQSGQDRAHVWVNGAWVTPR